MISWRGEIQLAARRLAQRPGFTLAVVLTLGLGVGAVAAAAAVVNSILLRPLPYPDSDRLVVIHHHAPGLDLAELELSEGMVRLYRESVRSLEQFAVSYRLDRNLTGGDHPARVSVVDASPELFDVLRAEPLLGRRFHEDDAAPGAEPVVILTYAGWQSYFGGDRGIIGRDLELDGTRTRVVGVLPKGFYYFDPNAVAFTPRYVNPHGAFGTFGLRAVGRLAPGMSLAEAEGEIAALQARIPELFPSISARWLENARWHSSVTPLHNRVVRDIETVLWVIFGTVAFIFLIALANVTNLYLVRIESRQRELAVRSALGAGRVAVLASFLTESVLLALGGGVVGIGLAFAMTRALVALAPPDLPRIHEIALDGVVLLLAALTCLAVGLGIGALAALRQARQPLDGALRGGRAATGSRERHRMRKLLIAGQVAAALVLLTGSGLMIRSFQRLRAVDPGVRTEGVLTFGISLGESRPPAEAAQLYQRVLDEVAALPGVTAVGASSSLPTLIDHLSGSSFRIRSRPREPGEVPVVAMFVAVTPGAFEAQGIPLLEGRTVERQDHEQARRVAWVNRRLVEEALGGTALGEQLQFQRDTIWLDIVGVVGDVRMHGLGEAIRPMIYLPMTSPTTGVELGLMYLTVHAAGEPLSLFPAIRRVLNELAPEIPLTTAQTMDQVLSASVVHTSFMMVLLGGAALVALLLGAVGLYGVMSYIVAQQAREIGIRMALGAQPGRVRALVLGQSLVAIGFGLLAGLGIALGSTRLMRALLFEVSPADPVAIALAALVLTVVGLIASYVPARRASDADPAGVLRIE
jgi:predicted permease